MKYSSFICEIYGLNSHRTFQMLQTISARIDKKLLSKFSFTEPHCFQVYISLKCSETNCEVFSLERKSRTWNFDIVLLWNENVIEISGCKFDYNLIKAAEILCIFSSGFFFINHSIASKEFVFVFAFISEFISLLAVQIRYRQFCCSNMKSNRRCEERKKNCSSVWNLMENSQTMGHSVNTLSEFSRNCNKKRRMLCCCIVCAYQRTGKIWTLIIMVGRMMAFGNRKQCKKKN